MAVRDISPTSYNAPGTARVSLNAILTAMGAEPLPFDVWISNYSPNNDNYINLASGFQALTSPDTTNVRFFCLILPNGNTQSCVIKGITGDTGLGMNPNGVFFFTPVSGLASVGVTAGAIITGARVIWA